MDDYSFRLAFILPPGRPLPLSGTEYAVGEGGQAHPVLLRSTVRDEDLSRATSLTLRGSGYPSLQEAEAAGVMWRGALQRSFAYVRAGADFGDRQKGGLRFSAATQRKLDEAAGTTVLPHRHGLMTFETNPPPEFRSWSARGYMPPDRERLKAALASKSALVPMGQHEHLAYTMYGSAFFVEVSTEARFMMLMMAYEALMDQEKRSSETLALIDRLVTLANGEPGPDADDQRDLVDGMNRLKRESLSQAGARLAESLGDQTYAEMSPRDFFKHVYKVRGRLVHPSGAGVDLVEIGALIGPLQDFVGDVLAGPALRDDVRPPAGRPLT